MVKKLILRQATNEGIVRSTLESYFGIFIAIILAVYAMTWYLKLILVLVLFGLSIDLSFHASWFIRWKKPYKIFLCFMNLLILMAIFWKPIQEQYFIDHRGNYIQLGEEIIETSNQILAFEEDRETIRVSSLQTQPENISSKNLTKEEIQKKTSDNVYLDWQKQMAFSQETEASFNERFGGKVFEELILLHSLGINAPFSSTVMMGEEPQTIGKWLGAIGILLKKGKLDVAIKITQDDNFWVNLMH